MKIILSIIIVLVLGFGAWYFYSTQISNKNPNNNQNDIGIDPLNLPEFSFGRAQALYTSELGTKLVYGTGIDEQYMSEARAHCTDELEGVFLTCGNPCAPDAEQCVTSCAWTCEIDLAPDPSGGYETQSINLQAVDGFEGTGIATREWTGAEFRHTVVVSGAVPAEGKFFEGWLVKKQPTLKFISTGRMNPQGGEYTLIYNPETNYTDYFDVVITEETLADGLDGVPERHILEGAFSQVLGK